MLDTTLHATRTNPMLSRIDTPPPQQGGVKAQPPRLYSIPPAADAASIPTLITRDSSTDEKRNVRSAALVELVGRVLIEKMFFQNLHIPQDLLLSLVNNVIQTVAPEQKTKIDVYREGTILCKQLIGKTLTPEEQRYEQAPKEIDVPREILNGIRYSAVALMGSNLYASVTSAINQGLWNHVPAIMGYGGAMVFGPKLIQAAVEKVLACSGLNPEQKKHLAPWLTTVGHLALGFLPKVNANERGVTYRHPSTEGHARIVTSEGTVTLAGDKTILEQQGTVETTEQGLAADDGMQFKLHAIREITQDKLKLYVIDQAGKKIPVEFTAIPHGTGKEIVAAGSDKRLEDHWNHARQPTLPITQTRDLTCPSALVLGAVASAVGQNALPALIASLSCWPEASASAEIRNEEAASSSKRAVMQQRQFPAVFNLSDLNGTNGFAVPGIAGNGALGVSVSSAGDINGDNITDLVLGAYGENANVGASYVIFGSRSPSSASFNLSQLDGANGFAIPGIAASGDSGFSVSSAGDINGDNIADLVVGAYGENSDLGASYVIFGSRSPFPASFNLSQLNGANGFTIPGIGPSGRSGYSVSTAGDINGDNIADLVIGAPNRNTNLGGSYVIFGSRSPFPASFNLNGTNGFTIPGMAASTHLYLGNSVSTAGDINGDNISDLVLGAYGGNLGLGAAYVIFGSRSPFPTSFIPSQLNGTNGFTIPGVKTYGYLGYSVSTAGDINGDNITDLVLGAYGANANVGASYVLFGSRTPFPASFDLNQLNGTNGFTIPGVAAIGKLGYSVSTAGDISGDNIADLMVGAWGENSALGATYVIFGSRGPFPASFDISQLDGANGFTIPGIRVSGYLGRAVGAAGDINGDNIADLVVGAYGENSGLGASYVIFGQKTATSSTTPTPTISPAPAATSPALTPCPIAQPLTLLNNVIQINQGQTLRVTPIDLSARCGNNTTPSPGTLFNITGIDHAQFKTRNSSGSWNNATSFLGRDLSQGSLELIHDNSALAPQINFTVTDGQTTLPETAANIQFNTSAITLIVSAININIQKNGTTILTPQQFQISSGGTRLDNVVISVTSVQGGYFTSGNSSTPINDFTYYQLQDGQIQFVHNGTMLPNITLTVGTGSGESLAFSPLVHFFNTDNPANPAVPAEAVVGSAAGAVVVTAAVGMTAWGVTKYRRLKEREKHKNQQLPYLVNVPDPQNTPAPRNS